MEKLPGGQCEDYEVEGHRIDERRGEKSAVGLGDNASLTWDPCRLEKNAWRDVSKIEHWPSQILTVQKEGPMAEDDRHQWYDNIPGLRPDGDPREG